MKEVLDSILSYMIQLDEIALVRQEKLNAVTHSGFEKAANLRGQETVLIANLPSLADFKEWRKQLNKE